ncbi:thymidine kinase [Hamiltosporidium tvaerminnensis]|uniref:Thymidine kinase n=2 Tax=Hamiltosporidium TaxID=1176354 RepID=A0A4Q9LK83_9MICR|nr:hypothetical protein LUQ84_000111 [Hamiltosporidium tvaerminnensis]TBT97486.1 thymidine kinase [Hamiltosporidium tvaerminnensis]TBU01262.1 thymidine kinase [Hamiltosporidium magnivora]TBU08306.1 thymidine kinase [Hamiltosporidium magnivora]TBU10480.1 thymidine kinase [Hamiltosporidium tvaerminnensis]
MAKLYFRYGAVSSAKTLNLLAVSHQYRQQGKAVVVIKPSIDTRFNIKTVRSRAGLETEADIIIHPECNIFDKLKTHKNIFCVLVDESQFFTKEHINQLRDIVDIRDIPVICYGLRTDFKTHLFPAVVRLFEICDVIEEVKSTCSFCNKKSTMNLKSVDGVFVTQGPSIEMGCEEKYLPACYPCFREKTRTGVSETKDSR